MKVFSPLAEGVVVEVVEVAEMDRHRLAHLAASTATVLRPFARAVDTASEQWRITVHQEEK